MRRAGTRGVLAAAAVMVVLMVGACSSGTDEIAGATTTLPPEEIGPPVVFVAVGGDETIGYGVADGLRDSWTQLVFREHLPRRSVHLNVASSGATVADALALQVPLALEVAPTLVTVWLAGADAAQATPVAAYERDLEQVVRQLQGDGSTRVVVAVGPPIVAGSGDTEPYDDAAERVAGLTGAGLVDLSAVDPAFGIDAHEVVASAVANALAAPR